MNSQSLFTEYNDKNVVNLLSADSAETVLKINLKGT